MRTADRTLRGKAAAIPVAVQLLTMEAGAVGTTTALLRGGIEPRRPSEAKPLPLRADPRENKEEKSQLQLTERWVGRSPLVCECDQSASCVPYRGGWDPCQQAAAVGTTTAIRGGNPEGVWP